MHRFPRFTISRHLTATYLRQLYHASPGFGTSFALVASVGLGGWDCLELLQCTTVPQLLASRDNPNLSTSMLPAAYLQHLLTADPCRLSTSLLIQAAGFHYLNPPCRLVTRDALPLDIVFSASPCPPGRGGLGNGKFLEKMVARTLSHAWLVFPEMDVET